MQYLFMILLFLTALFLILLVLVQRGKGGGLAGAFGGMGGQSAFGTKAGDLFTRVTIGVATAWILLCIGCVWYFGPEEKKMPDTLGDGDPKGGYRAPSSTEGSDGAGPAQPAPGGDSENS